ncbi:MAG: hypothetical protein E6K16_04400 [Methanobacteriota archaeon]|nr:MAG: hypothetical protein E6K16_04400 [Euryarchaeota archaeon]
MDRTARFTVAIAAIAIVAAVAILLIGLRFLDNPLTWVLYFLSWVIAATSFLAILFLPWYPVAEVRAPPDRVLAYLAFQQRAARHHVAEDPKRPVVTVTIDSTSAVKLRARPTPEGSRVSFQPFLTPVGLGLLVFLLIFPEFALLAFPVTAYIFIRTYRFVSRGVRPLLPPGEPLPAEPAPDDVGVLLITGLAEGHRLASDAYALERSAYHDNLLLVAFAAFVVWALVLIGTLVTSTDPDFSRRVMAATFLSISGAVGLGVGSGVITYIRFRPRLEKYRIWKDRLWEAWTREVSPARGTGPGPSAFELLAEGSRELPTWLEVRRRSGLSRDPALGFLVIAMVIWAFELLGGGATLLLAGNWLGSIAAFAVGIALSVGLYLLYGRMKRRSDEEAARDLATWNRRLETVRSEMERFLQDL